MENNAFFFQGISLLLPNEASITAKTLEIPLSFAAHFPLADIFTIPAPDGAVSGVNITAETPLPPNWQTIPVRQTISAPLAGLTSGTGQTARLLRAFHIAQWRRESLFCGSCGCRNTDIIYGDSTAKDTTLHDDSSTGPARLCPSCGRIEFPRIAPAIIVLITNDEGKVLLAHNKKFAPGIYSLIAGFVDTGENLETAVVREVREEIAIEIRDLRYIVSQPWPFPNSLMAGFSARYASGTVRPDGVELEDAQWFSRDKLPMLPGHGSVSRYLIERWLTE
jgi:NAD+ diphosphatase